LFFDFHVERLGYTGVVTFKHEENKNKDYSDDLISLRKDSSFQIRWGVMIYSNNIEDLKRKIQKSRNEADVLMVYGGDLRINRAACENPRVDIISHPYRGRRDCGINHISARKAAENKVAVELNVRYLLRIRPQNRYKVLGYYREILKLQRKFNFPLIITSGAHSIFELHTPLDIIALTYCFGMNEEEASFALSETPRNIIERRDISSNVVVKGARIIK
jgi:ribonuclease P/MRP protein subunit RPP1